jgi:hypothetical protein
MNSAKFSPAEHHQKQHGAAEADDKITEVLSAKIALSAASQPKDAAIFVQNPGGKHVINYVFSVLQSQNIEGFSEISSNISDRNAVFL